MANEEIKGIIEYVLKEQGLDKAIVRLRRLEDQNKKVQKSLDGLSKHAENFGKKIVAALAPIATTAFLSGAFREFANLDRAFTSLRAQLESIGAASEFDRVAEFLSVLESAGVGLQTETIPAFVRFAGITRDVTAALELTRIAAIQADGKQRDLGATAQAIANAWRGEVSEAATQLGIQIDYTSSKADQQKQFFEQLQAQTKALADQQRDAKSASAELEAAWVKLKREIGGGLGSLIIGTGISPSEAIDWIKIFGKSLEAAVIRINAIIVGMAKGFVAAFDLKTLLSGGRDDYVRAVEDAMVAPLEAAQKKALALEAEVRELYFKLVYARPDLGGEGGGLPPPPPPPGGKRGKTDEEREAERAARLIEESYLRAYEARMKALEDLKEAEAKATEESIEQAVEAAKTREEIEKAAAEEALQLRVQAAQETQDELQAQDDQLRIQSREALLAAIDEEQQAKLDQLAWEYGQQIAAAERVGADTADIKRNWEAKKTTIESQGERARLNVVRQTEALKQQLWFQSAGALLGALSQAFEGNKSIAIAQAIINTAEGATKALSQGGFFGIAMAAAVIAAGVAQINRIRSTTIAGSGGGFGGGGGSRRASAPIETRSPIRREAAEQERRGVQFRGEPQQVVNFNGPVVGGRQGARELARIVDRSRRDDGRRRLR